MTKDEQIADYWADWLRDATAAANQDRRFDRGDAAYDKNLTEALEANARKAIQNAINEANRCSLGHYCPRRSRP